MTLDANGKVPAAGAGVRVLFNGTPAPLLYVRQDQINAVVPFAVAGFDTARVQVENGQSALPPINVRVRSSDPGMFRLGSTEFGAVLNQNNSVNTPENAAERGSFITFWATGIGLFQSTFEDGGIVAEISSLRATVRVFFGGIEGECLLFGRCTWDGGGSNAGQRPRAAQHAYILPSAGVDSGGRRSRDRGRLHICQMI
jgi:uncharacterized protein (TIGR03437 family)